MKNKILIIEGDLSLSNILKLKFEGKKFDVFLSAKGKEGIEIARKEKPDAILLETALPDVSGFDILKKMMADDETRQIPVIILTNSSKVSEVDKAFELGAIDYLLKSQIDIEKIADRVSTFVAEHKEK